MTTSLILSRVHNRHRGILNQIVFLRLEVFQSVGHVPPGLKTIIGVLGQSLIDEVLKYRQLRWQFRNGLGDMHNADGDG